MASALVHLALRLASMVVQKRSFTRLLLIGRMRRIRHGLDQILFRHAKARGMILEGSGLGGLAVPRFRVLVQDSRGMLLLVGTSGRGILSQDLKIVRVVVLQLEFGMHLCEIGWKEHLQRPNTLIKYLHRRHLESCAA